MLLHIIQNTPYWVFGLFAVLLALGVVQMFTRSMSPWRVAIMGIALTALSVYGTISAFPKLPEVMLLWAATGLVVYGWVFTRRLPEGTRYDAWQNRILVPGSIVPLALLMGIFATKYAVGVTLAMQPALAGQYTFALVIAAVYGAFSGAFAARSARLLRMALRGDRGSPMLSA